MHFGCLWSTNASHGEFHTHIRNSKVPLRDGIEVILFCFVWTGDVKIMLFLWYADWEYRVTRSFLNFLAEILFSV